jgi:hypothetical protein
MYDQKCHDSYENYFDYDHRLTICTDLPANNFMPESCHSSRGYCRAQGDPHYVTYDGAHYDFMGTCTYLLSGVDHDSTRESNLPGFQVGCPQAKTHFCRFSRISPQKISRQKIWDYIFLILTVKI